jgi:hypothetical protein
MPDVPDEIQGDENIGRAVFDTDKAKQAVKGKIPPRVFQEKSGVRELSVDRLNYIDLAAAAAIQKGLRDKDCQGWAVLGVGAVCENGRQLIADPVLPNREHHAFILLPEMSDDQAFVQQKTHALELAMKAQWQAAPGSAAL